MMRKAVVLWITVLTMTLTGLSARAIPIHLEEGSLTVEAAAVDSEDGAAQAVDAQDFHLLSVPGDGSALIFADGAFLRISEGDIPDVIEQVGRSRLDGLADADDLETVRRGSDSADVKALQSALIDVGYLTGSADGQFGSKSAAAVSAFQAAMGLKQTGVADPLLQLLLDSVRQQTVNIVADYDPAMRYAPLLGRTRADLSAIADHGLDLEYDDITGTGTLGNGCVIGLDASGEADIDACEFELRFVLSVNPDASGEAVLTPVGLLRCECVRRPIMQTLLLKSGEMRCALAVDDLQAGLSGVRSVETGSVTLTADALRLLAGADEAGELKYRIVCKYSAYDGALNADQLSAVSEIGRAAQEME